MSAGAALFFGEVSRRFGRTVALDRVSLDVEPGIVLGLLGRNGAGKTTALRLAHGILWPDGGSIRVLGLDPVRQGLAVRERVSLLSEESALYPWMTVGEIERFAAALHPRWDAARASEFRERLGLDPGKKIASLSRGTKAKVALLLAVAVRPELLLLDDPTAGLDPLVRREVLEGILGAMADEGATVVYASHLVHDVERVADRVVVLDEGRIVLQDGIDALKARVRRVTAVFPEGVPALAVPGALDQQVDGRTLTAVVSGVGANGELEAGLRRSGAHSVETDDLPLEEILVACLRRRSQEASKAGEASHV